MSTGIDKATDYDGMDTVDMTMSVVIFQKEKADVETCIRGSTANHSMDGPAREHISKGGSYI